MPRKMPDPTRATRYRRANWPAASSSAARTACTRGLSLENRVSACDSVRDKVWAPAPPGSKTHRHYIVVTEAGNRKSAEIHLTFACLSAR